MSLDGIALFYLLVSVFQVTIQTSKKLSPELQLNCIIGFYSEKVWLFSSLKKKTTYFTEIKCTRGRRGKSTICKNESRCCQITNQLWLCASVWIKMLWYQTDLFCFIFLCSNLVILRKLSFLKEYINSFASHRNIDFI